MTPHNTFKSELIEFCENYLAYLADDYQMTILDRNREVNVYENPLDKKIHEELHDMLFLEVKIKSTELFYWNDIKDYIIPFLKIFTKRYKTKHITLREKQLLGTIFRQYKISDVVEDKLSNKKISEFILDLY